MSRRVRGISSTTSCGRASPAGWLSAVACTASIAARGAGHVPIAWFTLESGVRDLQQRSPDAGRLSTVSWAEAFNRSNTGNAPTNSILLVLRHRARWEIGQRAVGPRSPVVRAGHAGRVVAICREVLDETEEPDRQARVGFERGRFRGQSVLRCGQRERSRPFSSWASSRAAVSLILSRWS